MNEIEKKKIDLKTHLIGGTIAFVLGIIIFLLFFFLRGKNIISANDGLLASTVIILSIAGFMWIARNGFFDLLSYGFKQLGSMMFSKEASKYNDYPSYRLAANEVREKKPKTYISFLIVGGLFFVALIIVFIVYKQM